MRTVAAQVLRHSLSDVAGQRQSLAARPLARHGHSPRVPIEGIQRERGHLSGAQAQPGQQQDGAVGQSVSLQGWVYLTRRGKVEVWRPELRSLMVRTLRERSDFHLKVRFGRAPRVHSHGAGRREESLRVLTSGARMDDRTLRAVEALAMCLAFYAIAAWQLLAGADCSERTQTVVQEVLTGRQDCGGPLLR